MQWWVLILSGISTKNHWIHCCNVYWDKTFVHVIGHYTTSIFPQNVFLSHSHHVLMAWLQCQEVKETMEELQCMTPQDPLSTFVWSRRIFVTRNRSVSTSVIVTNLDLFIFSGDLGTISSHLWRLNRYFKPTHDVYRTLTEWFPSLNLTSIKKFQHICRIAQPAFIHWVDKIQHHYGCKSRSRACELFDSRLLENPVVVIKYHRSIIHIFSTDRRISLKVIVHLNQILPPRVIQHIIFNSLFC